MTEKRTTDCLMFQHHRAPIISKYCAQYISPSVTAITSPSPTATSLNTSKVIIPMSVFKRLRFRVQTPTPDIPIPPCAWVVFESNEDMVGVLGPELLPVEDVTDLNQTMWIRPQTCLCHLCRPPAPEDYD